jgi:hypothetical protein
MTRCSLWALACRICLIVSLAVAGAHADTDVWTTGSLNFWTAGPWSLGHPPFSTDTALFNQAATYSAIFDAATGDATVGALSVTAGNVTLRTISGPTRTLNVAPTSIGFPTSINGATVTLDNLTLNTGGFALGINSAATLNVNFATLTVGFGSMTVGAASTTGTLVVDGIGSSASASQTINSWGYGGGHAVVTFSNGATGTFGGLALAGSGTDGTTANVQVQSGARLNIGDLSFAADGAANFATLSVQGNGSTVTQSVIQSAATTVGHSSLGGATIDIGTTTSGAVFTTGTGSFTIKKTGTVTVGNSSSTGSLIASGDVAIDGGTLQAGPGSGILVSAGKTMTLSNAGKLKGGGNITGNIINGGVVAPGLSPGVLPISGNYTQTAIGTLEIELSSLARYDRLLVSGPVSLGGTLAVSLIDGFVPVYGSTFDILDWTTRSGTFASLQLPALAGGLQWNTLLLYTSGVLGVSIPGDFNLNGKVDAADYVVWRKNNGTQADYNLWRSHFGQTAGGAGASAGSPSALVPEPAIQVMLLVAALIMYFRRTPSAPTTVTLSQALRTLRDTRDAGSGWHSPRVFRRTAPYRHQIPASGRAGTSIS